MASLPTSHVTLLMETHGCISHEMSRYPLAEATVVVGQCPSPIILMIIANSLFKPLQFVSTHVTQPYQAGNCSQEQLPMCTYVDVNSTEIYIADIGNFTVCNNVKITTPFSQTHTHYTDSGGSLHSSLWGFHMPTLKIFWAACWIARAMRYLPPHRNSAIQKLITLPAGDQSWRRWQCGSKGQCWCDPYWDTTVCCWNWLTVYHLCVIPGESRWFLCRMLICDCAGLHCVGCTSVC